MAAGEDPNAGWAAAAHCHEDELIATTGDYCVLVASGLADGDEATAADADVDSEQTEAGGLRVCGSVISFEVRVLAAGALQIGWLASSGASLAAQHWDWHWTAA